MVTLLHFYNTAQVLSKLHNIWIFIQTFDFLISWILKKLEKRRNVCITRLLIAWNSIREPLSVHDDVDRNLHSLDVAYPTRRPASVQGCCFSHDNGLLSGPRPGWTWRPWQSETSQCPASSEITPDRPFLILTMSLTAKTEGVSTLSNNARRTKI